MISSADIIVRSPDSAEVSLLAETKLTDANLYETESQLKKDMLDLSCSIGILVTPKKLRIYRNLYLSNSVDSVEFAGEFDTSKVMGFQIDADILKKGEPLFAQLVQSWLEELASSLETSQYELPLRNILSRYVLPAISGGIVRPGGPRYQ